MKKLEKLTLNEMSNELTVISQNELSMVIGGGEPTPQSVVNYCLGEMESSILATYNVVADAFNDAWTVIGNFANNAKPLISDILEECATDLLNKAGGGNTPLGAPLFFIDNPALYNISPSLGTGQLEVLNSFNYGSPGTSFYSINTDYIVTHGGTGASSNDKNDLCTE